MMSKRICSRLFRRVASGATVLAALTILSFAGSATGWPPGGKGGGGTKPTAIDLHPVGAIFSRANGINDAGIIVGTVDYGEISFAGWWNANDVTPSFTPLWIGEALAINATGEIVGVGFGGPFYCASQTSSPFPLPLAPGYSGGSAHGISSDGVVAGQLYSDEGITDAALWRVVGGDVFGPVVLGPGGANDVAVSGLNTNRSVGRASNDTYGHVATAWDLTLNDDGTFTVIQSTTLVADHTSEAYAINDAGDIAGILRSPYAGFMIRSGNFTTLPNRGLDWGAGLDLNDTYVVGAVASVNFALNDPAMWDARGRLTLLPYPSAWFGASANGVNSSGLVVGFGENGVGQRAAWLLR